MEALIEPHLAGDRIVVVDQRSGVVDQDLRRHPAKVAEGAFQPIKPRPLALMAKGRHIPTPRVAQRRHEQKDPDHLAADRHPRRTKVDLQLPPRRRLKAHTGARLRFQLTAMITDRPLDRAQADPNVVLALQVLTNHVGVAPVLPQPFPQPALKSIESTLPVRPLVWRPRTPAQVTLHRVAAAAKLERDPLRAPAQPLQPQHHRNILRRLHHISPRSPRCGKTILRHCHVPSFHERGSVFVSPGGQFQLSLDTAWLNT